MSPPNRALIDGHLIHPENTVMFLWTVGLFCFLYNLTACFIKNVTSNVMEKDKNDIQI